MTWLLRLFRVLSGNHESAIFRVSGDTTGDTKMALLTFAVGNIGHTKHPHAVAGKSLKKRLEDNPVIYIVSLLILWGGGVWKVVESHADKRLDRLKMDYESKMASINRRLAGGEYF